MSHIPNSAMPHAGGSGSETSGQQEGGSFFAQSAGKVAEFARENPKTAMAAGAAVVGAVAAAAAIPLVRGRGETSGSSGSSGSGKKKS